MTTFHSITELIGNTPLLQLHKLNSGVSELFLKLENQNPGGLIKDRVAPFWRSMKRKDRGC